MTMIRFVIIPLVSLPLGCIWLPATQSAAAEPGARDLADFRTVDTCLKTELKASAGPTKPIAPARTGYFGASIKKMTPAILS